MDSFNYYGERVPGHTLPATAVLTWGQRNLPMISLVLDTLVGLCGGLYLILFLGVNEESIQVTGIVLMIVLPLGGLITYLLLSAAFRRSQWPVLFYNDGFETHLFAFDRWTRTPAFVPASSVAKVSVGMTPNNGNYFMTVKTVRDRTYMFGQRAQADIGKALDFIRKEWPNVFVEDFALPPKASVDAIEPLAKDPGKAYKVAVPQPSPEPVPAPLPPPATQTPISTAPAGPPVVRYCISCGKDLMPGSRFCPSCGQSASSAPTSPPSGQTSYLLHQRKRPRSAFLLGLLPGFLGIMGLGHFYTRTYSKGIAFLIIGGFLATMALGSLLVIADPPEGVNGPSYVPFAISFHAAFFTVLAWSSIDAKLTATRFNGGG